MSITAIVGAGISLADQIFKFINKKESRKYAEKLVKLRNELDTELRLPLEKQNDGKVERLEDEISNIMDLACVELGKLRTEKEGGGS